VAIAAVAAELFEQAHNFFDALKIGQVIISNDGLYCL